MTTIPEEAYEIVDRDHSNLWDQLRELINTQRWTTQDHATLSLLPEMDNVTSLFIVRKSDNYLLGATILIETDDFVYGNVYVMREGYRASGMGMKLVQWFMKSLGKAFATKPFIVRGVPQMMGKYSGPPFYALHLYEMFSYEFKDRRDLFNFFPLPKVTNNYKPIAIKDLTPRQFHQFTEYDRNVTGFDRSKFLREYYSVAFVEGVVLFDEKNQIRGMIGLVPTTNEGGLYKMNPIFAESIEDCCLLVHLVVARIHDPNAHFVGHSRTDSAGDWILKKCKEEGRHLHLMGPLCSATNMNVIYKDCTKAHLIHAPTNSPVHFDG